MRSLSRLFLVASVVLVPAHSLFAQSAVDPSGHWTGAVHVPAFDQNPAREVAIEVDLARDASGALAGTFGQPAQGVKGLPLSAIAADGTSIAFEIRVSDGGIFNGTFSDATTMSGRFVTTQGGHAIPFSLRRTGDAWIAPAPKNAAIGKELEGTWNGSLDVGGTSKRLVLKIANQPDGTAIATIVDLDGSGIEIPIAVTQQAAHVALDIAVVGGSYAGVLHAGTQLVGTWTQGPVTLPLSFKRAQ